MSLILWGFQRGKWVTKVAFKKDQNVLVGHVWSVGYIFYAVGLENHLIGTRQTISLVYLLLLFLKDGFLVGNRLVSLTRDLI